MPNKREENDLNDDEIKNFFVPIIKKNNNKSRFLKEEENEEIGSNLNFGKINLEKIENESVGSTETKNMKNDNKDKFDFSREKQVKFNHKTKIYSLTPLQEKSQNSSTAKKFVYRYSSNTEKKEEYDVKGEKEICLESHFNYEEKEKTNVKAANNHFLKEMKQTINKKGVNNNTININSNSNKLSKEKENEKCSFIPNEWNSGVVFFSKLDKKINSIDFYDNQGLANKTKIDLNIASKSSKKLSNKSEENETATFSSLKLTKNKLSKFSEIEEGKEKEGTAFSFNKLSNKTNSKESELLKIQETEEKVEKENENKKEKNSITKNTKLNKINKQIITDIEVQSNPIIEITELTEKQSIFFHSEKEKTKITINAAGIVGESKRKAYDGTVKFGFFNDTEIEKKTITKNSSLFSPPQNKLDYYLRKDDSKSSLFSLYSDLLSKQKKINDSSAMEKLNSPLFEIKFSRENSSYYLSSNPNEILFIFFIRLNEPMVSFRLGFFIHHIKANY